MFEHYSAPLATKKAFLHRVLYSALLGFMTTLFSLLIGILGYHNFEKLSWIDSLLNASMILGGMGPVATLQTDAGKLFATFGMKSDPDNFFFMVDGNDLSRLPPLMQKLQKREL